MANFNIPIFVPHRGCPFDCVFCNQKRITGELGEVSAEDVKSIISEHLKTIPQNGSRIEAAFFGGSFTGIPIGEQSELLAAAHEFLESNEIDGIRLSTRPDYINREILGNLLKYGVTTIELGVQSMDDSVLLSAGRGHTSGDVIKAVGLIREYPFRLGLQMMTGLPGDTPEKSIETAGKIIALKPDMVRIYPTLTIRDTALADMYYAGSYVPMPLPDTVELCKRLLLMFEEHNITVIRMGLQSTDEIAPGGSVVAGPVHSAFGELVEASIYYDLIEDKIKDLHDCRVIVTVNDREISKAAGNRKSNIERFKRERNIDMKIKGDRNLGKREVICTCC